MTTMTEVSVEQRLTDPELLMRPERLQALAPSRVSAARAVLERVVREGWRIERVAFDIDENSSGEALYRVHARDRVFDFVVYGFEPDLSSRTGRITEKNWDMMAALIEGETTPESRAVTREELPKLYVGRAVPGTLTWARSNRSFRAFDHVVDALADGRQPDTRFLWEIGYLMRNTGLDGNGTFNTRSFLALDDEHPLRDPLHAQLFTAYLMREYAADLVNTLAAHRSDSAVELSPELRRMIGIGNGSALGLLFFVNTHPMLVGQWMRARQILIVEASKLTLAPGSDGAARIAELLDQASAYYAADPYLYQHFQEPHLVGADLAVAAAVFRDLIAEGPTTGERLLGELVGRIDDEAWEVVAANLLELLPAVSIEQALAGGIRSELMRSQATMRVDELRDLIEREYAWALAIDMDAAGARDYVWYKSADAEEPRRGPAGEVAGGRNWALDLPGDIQSLVATLDAFAADERVGRVLAARPDLRGVIERVQSLAGLAYHSPHMNMLDREFVPVSIVRFMNAAIHGLHRTVDTEDLRNVLGLIYIGAPTAADIADGTARIDPYPAIPGAQAQEAQR
ncbi:hypothetical protein [Agromyces allii]|uniref:Uncharacterized protein n=1 Tax=Agromyces allii TaxID=393607 RepID=A0ABN2R3T4_9MICO|nr:hypothetical protein [Agromyces allii]